MSRTGRAILALARYEFTDVVRHPAPILMRCLTLPIYVFALSSLWNGVQAGPGGAHFPTLAYFLFTQTILDGWLNRFSIASLVTGFEAALLRPVSWPAQGGAQAFARTSAQLVVIGGLVLTFLALTEPSFQVSMVARWLAVVPLIALADAFATEVLAGLYLRIGKSDSLRFVATKSLLTLGGGLYPLLGDSSTWIGFLRLLPFSDFVFQPAYFCLTGDTFGMTVETWLLRALLSLTLLALSARLSFRFAWRGLQVAGG